MYKVRRAPPTLRSIINPRRGATPSAPLLDWEQWAATADSLFSQFGLEQFAGCVTAEMYCRPVPHVFQKERVRAITELYSRRGPGVLARLMANISPPLQPLNKQSRLGWPFFYRPDSKKVVLMPFFERIMSEGVEATLNYEGDEAFIIMNVRLQPEDKDKERQVLIIDDSGTVKELTVTRTLREVKVPMIGTRVASRTRLVFNMPAHNLFKQPLDTAIHDELLRHPAFHHDMYTPGGTIAMAGDVLFFDVKSFERHTAEVARLRGQLIGGGYGQIVAGFSRAPFLVPSDSWKSLFFINPDRDAGFADQYASGDSAVAPAQKEIFACIYQEVAERLLHIAPSASLDWVFGGGDARMTIRNYGDDNALSGDGGLLREAFAMIKEYLEAEEEDPPKFLGFLWTRQGWRLGPASYLTKTYLNERRPGSNFRKYPLFGWAEKRKVYQKYGTPELVTQVFPRENDLLQQAGHPWTEILRLAAEEALIAASASGSFRKPSWLLDKDYMMSAEEKIATGLYEGLEPSETGRIIKFLVGKQWKLAF